MRPGNICIDKVCATLVLGLVKPQTGLISTMDGCNGGYCAIK